MELGRVRGAVWCTRKSGALGGCKLLLVERWDPVSDQGCGQILVCADPMGAGVGEKVLLTRGGGARRAVGPAGSPVDAAVAAIVDGWEVGF